MQYVCATALLHGVDKNRTKVLTGFRTHHVLNINPAAGVVGNLITPHAVTGDACKVGWLVLVELRAVHHLQPFMPVAQVVKCAK